MAAAAWTETPQGKAWAKASIALDRLSERLDRESLGLARLNRKLGTRDPLTALSFPAQQSQSHAS